MDNVKNTWTNNKNTRIHRLLQPCPLTFFLPENRAIYEIMWRKTEDPERLQMTIWRMRFLCLITKATNTQSEYLMKITSPR